MSEEKLQEKFKKYQELAKENKDIDVANLMMKDLEEFQANFIPINKKRWAYMLSLVLPFVGFYFSLKFFSSKTEDGQEAGLACGILACASMLIYYFIISSLTSGLDTQQLLQLRPSDIQSLTQ